MKIAIVRLSSLGDIVHSMIVLQFIKTQIPNSMIDWFVEKSFVNLLKSNSDIDNIYPVSIKYAKQQKSIVLLLKELKKLKKHQLYDVVIDMQGLLKSAIIAKLIPSKITAGFDSNSVREKLAAKFYNQTCAIGYGENVIFRNIALIQNTLNIAINNNQVLTKKPLLFTEKKNFNLSTTKKNIVLVLGASFEAKIYPINKYAKVIAEIDANFIMIWGNDKELAMAQQLQNFQTNTIISKQLNLIELTSLISQVDLVIGGDTGPTHMAWALNIPSITLFGATPANRNALTTSINKILGSTSKVDYNKIDKMDLSIAEIQPSKIVKMTQSLIF